jgi:hypothetical protein
MLLRSALALLTFSAIGACSAAAGNGQQGTGAGAGSGAGGDGQLFGGNGGSDPGAGSTSGTGSTVNGTGADFGGTGITTRDVGNCKALVSQGEQLPLDIYVMFDISLSMSADVGNGQNRLDAERAALETFIADPASAGMKVGIGYFGVAIPTSCNPADYSTPEVPIAPLPGNAGPIKTSLDSKSPTGETPTPAAITGAATYAKQWAQAHPADVTVILLVTDGVPEAPLSQFLGCNPTLPDAIAAAASSAGQPPQIPVYVLGVGPSLDNLTQIAQSGGTQQAYLVGGGNVEQAVLDALNKIRGSAQVPCTYTIPPPPMGQTFDPAKVNIQYTPPGGVPGIVYSVTDQGSCDPAQGGWYYGDSQTIKLCDATCTQVTSQTGGIVDVALGCTTQNRPK